MRIDDINHLYGDFLKYVRVESQAGTYLAVPAVLLLDLPQLLQWGYARAAHLRVQR